VLRYLGDERAQLSTKEQQQVEDTLHAMKERHGYCEHCAKDGIVLLLSKRYTD
jgi:serine protein kinase